MADQRIRQLEREYRASPTEENLDRFLHGSARVGYPIDLLESLPVVSHRSVPFETPYLCITLLSTGSENIWGPWGLEEEDFGNPDVMHPLMKEIFGDAGLAYPPSRATDIDIFGEEFFFIYFEPKTTRAEVAHIVDSINNLGHPGAAEGLQRMATGSPEMLSLIGKMENYPYPNSLLGFFENADDPIWEYPGSDIHDPLPRDISNQLKQVVDAQYSIGTMNFILSHPVAPSLNILVKGTPLRKMLRDSLLEAYSGSWGWQGVTSDSYEVINICLNIPSWYNSSFYAVADYDPGFETDQLTIYHTFSVVGWNEEAEDLLGVIIVTEEHLNLVKVIEEADIKIDPSKDLCIPGWAYESHQTHYADLDEMEDFNSFGGFED